MRKAAAMVIITRYLIHTKKKWFTPIEKCTHNNNVLHNTHVCVCGVQHISGYLKTNLVLCFILIKVTILQHYCSTSLFHVIKFMYDM